MTAGGVNLILLILLIAFISSPFWAAIAIFQMENQAKPFDRYVWCGLSILMPIFLFLIAGSVHYFFLDLIRENAIFGLSIIALYLITPFSSLIALELFKKRFPKDYS